MAKKILFLLFISLSLHLFSQEKKSDKLVDLNKVSLFPNPITNGKVTVRFLDKVNVTNIAVFSAIGKKVYERKKPKIINSRFNIRNLKSGVYLLKISTDKQSITKKLVVK